MAGRLVSSPYLVKPHQKIKLSHFPPLTPGAIRTKKNPQQPISSGIVRNSPSYRNYSRLIASMLY